MPMDGGRCVLHDADDENDGDDGSDNDGDDDDDDDDEEQAVDGEGVFEREDGG